MMLRFFVYLKIVLLLSFVYILVFYKCQVVIHLKACCLYQAQGADIGIRVTGDGWHARTELVRLPSTLSPLSG